MKISRLLNKILSIIFLIIVISLNSYAEDEPVDIWNINKKEVNQNSIVNSTIIEKTDDLKNSNESEIYKMQSQKNTSKIDALVRKMQKENLVNTTYKTVSHLNLFYLNNLLVLALNPHQSSTLL